MKKSVILYIGLPIIFLLVGIGIGYSISKFSDTITSVSEDQITIRVCAQEKLLQLQDELIDSLYNIIEIQNPLYEKNYNHSSNPILLKYCDNMYADEDYTNSLVYPK